jgi:cytochrome o ubiquinol oxidase subunit 3
LWMVVMIAQLKWQGVTVDTFRRLVVFSLFWHFLDLVWIFIFTFVYLMGVIV